MINPSLKGKAVVAQSGGCTAVIKGIRVDRPDTPTTVPTTKPAAQSEPLPDPDFPIAIDGIRPDRPKPNTP